MKQPHVILLIGDCLRAADAHPDGMPFSLDWSDTVFERCYAPSTWTLPSHASLYAQRTPIDHGVTRRGDVLAAEQARLPNTAREAGYETALFSENPTFSTHTGFNHGIDYVDDFINGKLFRSTFALEHEIDELSGASALSALRSLLGAPEKTRDIPNALYAPLSYARTRSKTRYPHNGNRVLSHLRSFLEERAPNPTLSFVNLLDTHNPHNAPPSEGERALGVSISRAERKALWELRDNKLYLFDEDGSPPTDAQDVFHDWDGVFSRKKDVYDVQIRYLDLQIESFVRELAGGIIDDALVVITGDHGQLFGEEEMVGHHTSLHPGGVQVPLFVRFPSSWDTENASVSEPVSWIGLSRALGEVTTGAVDSTEAFVERVRTESQEDGAVVVTADGPTWSVPRLREQYDSPVLDELSTRKVGLIEGTRQVVYESKWADTDTVGREYELVGHDREAVGGANGLEPHPEHGRWLSDGSGDGVDTTVSSRLEQLGYI